MPYPISSIRTTTSSKSTTPASASEKRKPTSAQEMIRENLKSLIAQLEAGHSETLTAYLNVMSRFHRYSFFNVLEIARQCPTATRVAGMYAWNQLGRRVKKGEKGIRILAPILGIRRKPDEEAEKDIRIRNERVLVGSNDYAGPDSHSRITQPPCCLPPTHQGVGILINRLFEAQ
jgi:hypothetical protein